MRSIRVFSSLFAAAMLAAGTVGAPLAFAEAPMVKSQAPGFHRVMLGDFEVTALSDGTVKLPMLKLLAGAPPEVLGHHVAAALVGTFLGILVSYGFISPMACAVEAIARDENKYMQCMMVGLISSAQGASPRTAIEQVRRVIYSSERPTTVDVAEAVNTIKSKV